MKRLFALVVFVLMVVSVFAAIRPAEAQGGKPPNRPAKGLIYDGLDVSTNPACKGGFTISFKGNGRAAGRCTHGPDAAQDSTNIAQDVAPITNTTPVGTFVCDGDGASGKRAQVIYAYQAGTTSRYSTYLVSMQSWSGGVNTIFKNSAAETAGTRAVRFVHDANCIPTVLEVQLSSTGLSDLGSMENELIALGFNDNNHKYVVFADAHIYCGISDIVGDDQAGASNGNNLSFEFARTDNGCWSDVIPAHELMHSLGGVQLSAPHSSGGWHCTDGYDRMCYSDSPYYPTMTYACTNTAYVFMFDCGHDDYFSTNPPAGSYLATHWNSANNQFLIGAPVPSLAHIASLITGKYVRGTWTATDSFKMKDTVVVRARVLDQNNQPIAGASVTLIVRNPDGSTQCTLWLNNDANGNVEGSCAYGSRIGSGTSNVHVNGLSGNATLSATNAVIDHSFTHP